MKVYDASSILELMERETLPDILDSSTTPLAVFEIGNAVWKQVRLTKKLTESQGERIFLAASLLVQKMRTVMPDALHSLTLALKEDLTFYDASYLQSAIEAGSEFVTEDRKLQNKAEKYVKVLNSSRLLK